MGPTSTDFYANVGGHCCQWGHLRTWSSADRHVSNHADGMRNLSLTTRRLHRDRATGKRQFVPVFNRLNPPLRLYDCTREELVDLPAWSTARPTCSTHLHQSLPTTHWTPTRRHMSQGTHDFATSQCLAPTVTTINGVPTDTASNCPADNIQSVRVDLQVLQPDSRTEAYQENSFTVYRLSSSSYLYRANLG